MTWAYTIETGTMETQPLQETACWETTTTAGNRVELCYNWNRYYDPGLGMYTQTDKVNEISNGIYLTAIQQFPEVYNNYAYAAANPIGYFDPNGLWTLGIGGSLNGGAGGGASRSKFLVSDDDGRNATTDSQGFGGYGGIGGGLNFELQLTNADSVCDLKGDALVAGGSFCVLGLCFGAEYISGDGYGGFNFGLGVGGGPIPGLNAELHGFREKTKVYPDTF